MDLFFGVFFIFMIATVVIWIAALVDILKSEFVGQNDKLIWILVVVLTGFIGAIIYYFIGTGQKRRY